MHKRQTNYSQFAGATPRGDDWPWAVGEVRGVRMWRVSDDGRLRPLHIEIARPWTEGVNEAVCCLTSSPLARLSHDAPSDWCGCGFYAYFFEETPPRELLIGWHMLDVFPMVPSVVGIIRGYGRTLIGTSGFRCQKAEIESIYLNPDTQLSKMIERQYPGVPRVRRPEYERLTRHGWTGPVTQWTLMSSQKGWSNG